MSSLKDILGFEKFHLKDMWKKIKDDPERLLLGGITPWDTKVTNKLTGKDYEPLVDQMGGAYGGSTITLGDTGEGVYGRAREAGVPTEAGAGMHDIAHVIASVIGGGYGADKLGATSFGGKLNSFMDKVPSTGGFGFGGGGGQAPPTHRDPYRSTPPMPLISPAEGPAMMAQRTRPSRQQMLAETMMRRV